MARFSSSDRHHIFDDVDRWEPLTTFTRQQTSLGMSNERITANSMKNFKVETLFDYSLLQNGQNGKKVVQLDGIAPVIEGLPFVFLVEYVAVLNNFLPHALAVTEKVADEDDPNFKGDSCQLEHRRRTEGTAVETIHSMEVPIALTRYLRPNLNFDVVTTKTFLTMLCRFIDNEHRFYRFNIERIGNITVIEEIPYGDARPSKTYLQGALDILTGRGSMDFRQVSICEFGTKRILLRQHVDLAESSNGRTYTQTFWQHGAGQLSAQDSFFPALKDMIPSLSKVEAFIEQPEPIFNIEGTTVAVQGSLVPETPKKPIEIMCRSFQRFAFENLQMKWPNMIFSGADRIISVLHVRGLIDHKPKSFAFEDIAPKGYKNTMARASTLCRNIFDYIQSVQFSDGEKMALIWVNDKQFPSDVNDGNHIVLYRRRSSAKASEESSFVSSMLRATLTREAAQ